MIIPIAPSYLKTNYQLLAWVNLSNYGLEESFDRICAIVYDWGRQKCAGSFYIPEEIQSINKLSTDTGRSLGVVYEHIAHFFCLKLSHPDNEIAGRYWNVDVELSEIEGALHFAVRQSVSTPKNCKIPTPYARPIFVKNIAINIGLVDCGWSITEAPKNISTEDDITALAVFLSNLSRNLPVVALTPCNGGEGKYNGYTVNGEELAKKLFGYAHVVCISKEGTYALTNLLGADWTVYDGAVRTYYPGLDFEESNKYAHPLVTKWGILNSGEPTEMPFEYRLKDYIQQSNGRRTINWADEKVQFYFLAEQNRLSATHVSEEDIAELRASYEEQIKQLESSVQEYISLSDSYKADADVCQQDCDEMRRQINALKGLIEAQKTQIADLKKGTPDKIPIGSTYEGMATWVEEHFPDRLYFHPRAIKALKNAVYKDCELVYRCLMLLATDYNDFRLGKITREEFDIKCKEVDPGLEERPAITDVAAGLQGETYYVTYAGKRNKLERHLTKGVSHNPLECLRIYFFWDDANSLVVIGSLPGHLDTRDT